LASQEVAPSSDDKSSSSDIAMSNDAVRDNASPYETESMGDTGLEHIRKSPEKQRVTSASDANSGAALPSGSVAPPTDLKEVVDSWSRLPAAVQTVILAIIRASE
jgi:hypothetical protein